MKDLLTFNIDGHCHIEDDLGTVHLDKFNAIHPQNCARVMARALSNESNYHIHAIAFGNGGTQIDASYAIDYKLPHDGQPPNDVRTWDSRLYHEIYREIVDDSSISIGTDPGSAGPNAGTRPGGGDVAINDPATIEHVSGPGTRSSEFGLISTVTIVSVLNPDEPTGQSTGDINITPDTSFQFDEIGLYTTGDPAIDSSGSQDVDVGDKNSESFTGLTPLTTYDFTIIVDELAGGTLKTVTITTPTGGSGSTGEITYGDLCEAINTGDPNWGMFGSSPLPGQATIVTITDNTLSYPTITGAQTYNNLRFSSSSTGAESSIELGVGTVNDLFGALGGVLKEPTPGLDAGVQNSPTNPTIERERLLTHLTFSPVLKSSQRTLTVTYTLTISFGRSE